MPLEPLPESFQPTRLALHRVAAYVVSPARRQAMGRMGLRAAPGGFGTPNFAGPDGMTVVRVQGADLVVDSAAGLRRTPITSLAAAGEHVGVAPDVAWAADLDIPVPGELDAPLDVDPASASALAAWYEFGWSILEQFSMDPDSVDGSEPQLWPEHFDPAIELGSNEAKARASYGFSPGDVNQDASIGAEELPYLYVGPWYPDDKPNSDFFNEGRLAVLRHEELVASPDPRAAAVAFFAEGRRLLQG